MRPQLDHSPTVAPAAWVEMARQLTSAFLFLDEHTPVVHLDIKPDNVFYLFDAPRRRYHYWLGDFGICSVDHAAATPTSAEMRSGSAQYMPPRASAWHHRRGATLRAVSLFQFFATLVDMLRLPPSPSSPKSHHLSDATRADAAPNVAARLAQEAPELPPLPRVCADALLDTEPADMGARLTRLRDLLVDALHPSTHRTGVCLDWGAVAADGRVVAPRFLPEDEADHIDEADPVTQRTASTADIQGMRLARRLGQGSYGVAFLGRLQTPHLGEQPLVVKLPKALVADAFLPPHPADLPPDTTVADALLPAPRPKADGTPVDMEQLRREFLRECRCAARFLEPRGVYAARSHKGIGPVLTPVPGDQWRALREEARAWRAHLGAGHWHQILHLDTTLPALLSAPADGSLQDLQEQPALRALLLFDDRAEGPSPLWLRIAEQLAEAVSFMRASVDITHVDLKPANILYVARAGMVAATLECRISDYGMCHPRDMTTYADARGRLPGTALYCPTANAAVNKWDGRGTMGDLSLFQTATTLLDLLDGAGAHGFLSTAPPGSAHRCVRVADALRERGHPLMVAVAVRSQRVGNWREPLYELVCMALDAPEKQRPRFERFEERLLELAPSDDEP